MQLEEWSFTFIIHTCSSSSTLWKKFAQCTDKRNKGYPPSCMKMNSNISRPNKRSIATLLQLHWCFKQLNYSMKIRAWGPSQLLSLSVCASSSLQGSVAHHCRWLLQMTAGGCTQTLEMPSRDWVHSHPGMIEHNTIWLKGLQNRLLEKGGGVRHGRDQTGKRRRDQEQSHWEEQMEGQEEEPGAKCCWTSNPWWFRASVHQLSSYSEDQHLPASVHGQASPTKHSDTAL